MKLPKIDVPVFTIDLPLSKQKIRYRPFLVKEEKILLMAMESEDEKTIMDSIKQVVNNCSLDEINVDDLPVLDIEYFFLNLRARSIGEVVDLQYRCNNTIEDDKKCNNLVKIQVNLLDVVPEVNPNHKNKIEFTEKLGMVMRYPNMKMIENIEESSEVEKVIKVISNCVEYIYDEDNIYYKKDIEEKDMLDFIENMTKDQFQKVQEFFETIPKIKKQINFKCNKCSYQEKIDVEGIQNFFV